MAERSTLSSIIERARQKLDGLAVQLSGRIDPAAAERIQRERYARLMARQQASVQREALMPVITVRRGKSLLGLPMEHAREIRRVVVTPLPHATSYVPGLFELQGQVGCLVDLGPLLGAVDPLPEDGSTLAAFVEDGNRVLALRIDEIIGPRTVYKDECNAQSHLRGHDFVSAITTDLVAVIDIPLLFALPEIVIDRRS